MMKALLGTAILASLVALSGCYTVIQTLHSRAPVTVAGTTPPSAEAAAAPSTEQSAEDQWQDLYRYPGTPGGTYGGYGGTYGYGGYPMTTSQGYYGYAASPYYNYSGYGPSSYGYDPYYRDSYGYYVPAGYKLITEAELDAIRAGSGNTQPATDLPDPAELLRLQQEEQRKAEETWARRSRPQVQHAAPAPTVRQTGSTASSTSSVAPPTTSKGSSSSPKSSSSAADSSTKSSTTPKKRRR
jgi:hypothetical protein